MEYDGVLSELLYFVGVQRVSSGSMVALSVSVLHRWFSKVSALPKKLPLGHLEKLSNKHGLGPPNLGPYHSTRGRKGRWHWALHIYSALDIGALYMGSYIYESYV